MIATLAEVKARLKITDDTQDALIEALMPDVQGQIVDYCGNYFWNRSFEYNGALTFVSDGVNNDIIQGEFADLPFQRDIHVSQSELDIPLLTTGYLYATSKTDTEIVLESIGEVYNEETTARLMNVKFPVALKIPFSNMIGYNLNRSIEQMGVTSESKIDYSIGYESLSGMMYPSEIVEVLKIYRNVLC